MGKCGSPNMDGAWIAWWGVAQEASKDQPNMIRSLLLKRWGGGGSTEFPGGPVAKTLSSQ